MDKQWINIFTFLAEQDDKEAMLALAHEYINKSRKELTLKERSVTISYLTKLAEDENVTNITTNAMLTLGTLYHSGWFEMEKDYPKARQYYEKATTINQKTIAPIYESTHATHWALNNLGYHHYYGLDREVNHAKAFYYFAKATFYRNYNAMYKLGDMYYYGLYVNQDYETAFYWYNEAERHVSKWEYGYPNIMYRLGLCNIYGHGTEKNLITALSHLQQAEVQFYKLIMDGKDDFANRTLPKVQKELDTVRGLLNQYIEV